MHLLLLQFEGCLGRKTAFYIQRFIYYLFVEFDFVLLGRQVANPTADLSMLVISGTLFGTSTDEAAE